jgi:microcystin-dependent protein
MVGLSDNADVAPPTNNLFGVVTNEYAGATNLTSLAPGTVANVGGSQAHLNMQPFLVLNFSIALQGIFPSQT